MWILVIIIKNSENIVSSTLEFETPNGVLRWLTKYTPERIHTYTVTRK